VRTPARIPVDDYEVVRKGVVAPSASHSRSEVCGKAGNGKDDVEKKALSDDREPESLRRKAAGFFASRERKRRVELLDFLLRDEGVQYVYPEIAV